MRLFDFRRFRSFSLPDPSRFAEGDPTWRWHVRRHSAKPGDVLHAQRLFEAGAYPAAIDAARSLRDGAPDLRLRARAAAIYCRALFAQGQGPAARPFADEFAETFGPESDPFVRAQVNLVLGTRFLEGVASEEGAYEKAGNLFREAIDLFESCGEIELAIFCRLELAVSLSIIGRYLSSIREAEIALERCVETNEWFSAGRLLIVGCAAAADQGYRDGVEETLRRAISWCDFVGDFWGRMQGRYALARLMSYRIPIGDPEAAAEPERHFKEAIAEAEAHGALGLSAHLAASLAWLYDKSGEENQRRRLMEEEARRQGGRRKHFDGMYTNSGDVTKTVNLRIAARLHDGIEDHPDGFFIFDARRDRLHDAVDFINEYRNEAAAQMLGLIPGSVFLYSEARDHPYLTGLSDALLDAVESQTSFEDEHSVSEGDDCRWYSRRVVPSGDGAILIVRDVTAAHRIGSALREAAESAARSDRAKSEFLANMSHEIRTPINGVLGLARLLADTPLNANQRAYVEDIVGSGDILIRVIGNVLDLSQIESQSMQIDLRPCAIDEIVLGTVRLFQGQAKEKGLVLSTTIKPNTPQTILADGPRVRQVVANLVGNAVKFTSEGSVSVLVGRSRDQVSIEISDTGMGIPPDRLDAIFERFQQASAESREHGGAGLGLTISRGIVGLMGGSLTVTSEVGRGSRFVVRLPVVETAEANCAANTSPSIRLAGMRVLVVDDNRVNRMVSRYALERLGCSVLMAEDGAKAVDIWRSETVDAILMDVRMPVMDGLEATREIRRQESGKPRIPIVALTAGALIEERAECFEAGMDDYISKPFTDDQLRDALFRLLPQQAVST